MSVRPRLAVLAVLAAGGAAFGGYYLWPSGRHVATCAPKHAPVPAAAQKALAGYGNRIRESVERSQQGTRSETWADQVTGRSRQVSYRADGRIENAFGIVPDGTSVRTVLVWYRAKLWMTRREHGFPRTAENEAAMIAQGARDEVANGKAAIVGRALVDGRPTLHLRRQVYLPKVTAPTIAQLPKAVARPRTLHIDTWVDPLTYLPVRSRTRDGFGWTVSDTKWLPRTPAAVAKTTLVVPRGFKRETESASSVEYAHSITLRCGQS
jgi:hypothetical protein